MGLGRLVAGVAGVAGVAKPLPALAAVGPLDEPVTTDAVGIAGVDVAGAVGAGAGAVF